MELNKKELNSINGGGISGAVLSSIIKGINTIYEVGKAFGSSIRRMFTRKYC